MGERRRGLDGRDISYVTEVPAAAHHGGGNGVGVGKYEASTVAYVLYSGDGDCLANWVGDRAVGGEGGGEGVEEEVAGAGEECEKGALWKKTRKAWTRYLCRSF